MLNRDDMKFAGSIKRLSKIITMVVILSLLTACMLSSCGSIENIKVTKACKDALRANPNINYTKIICNVTEGIAYLSGWVYTEKEKEIAEEIVRGVEGVTDVRNTIQIEEGGETNPLIWIP